MTLGAGTGWVPDSGRAAARPRVGAGFASYIGNFQGAGWRNTPVLGPASGWEGRAAPRALPIAAALSAPPGSVARVLGRGLWQVLQELGAGGSLLMSPVSLPQISASELWLFAGTENPGQDAGGAAAWCRLCRGDGVSAPLAAGSRLNPWCGLEALRGAAGAAGPPGRRGTP